MNAEEIIKIWLNMNYEGYRNYFHDFMHMYCEDGEIVKTFPISCNDQFLNGRMIPKTEVGMRIRKNVNCDKLYYVEPDLFNPHNPYHNSVGELYLAADSTQEYLKKWLLFITYQKLSYNKIFSKEYQTVFKELCYQLMQEYKMGFGNAKRLLPLMEDDYYIRKIPEDSLEMILYKFKAEMNYVKANNFFVLIEENMGWCKT